MEIEIIKNKKLLVQWLEKHGLKELDLNKSLQDRSRWSINLSGERIYCGKLKELAEAVNGKLDVTIDASKSRPVSLNTTKLVYYKEELPVEEEKPEELLEEKEILPEEKEDEEVITSQEDAPSETVECDWEYINSLEDTPEGKKALAEYAEKHFDTKIKRNSSLDNMKKSLKRVVESKLK